MASRAFRQLESLAERRRGLRAELEALEVELRDATVDAVREGVPAAPASRLAGVSRETLYKWLRSAGVTTSTLASERRLEAEIARVEARHEARVAEKMGENEPAGALSRRANWRSGYQWENLGLAGSSKARYRSFAERELYDDAETQADATALEDLRGRLATLRADTSGFFAGV